MKKQLLSLASVLVFSLATQSFAESTPAPNPKIVGLDTNGRIFEMAPKTGAITAKGEVALGEYSLGASTRKGSNLFFVAVPSGAVENALFTTKVNRGTSTSVDLDRSESVRALFFSGKSLYGVFYDGNLGTAGVYRINQRTGVTSLVLNLSDLNVEPIAGAITQYNGFFFMLVKPEIDAGRRQLLKFKLRAGSAVLSEIVDRTQAPVQCDKLKTNTARKEFVCLASAADETQVNFCRLGLSGRATCLNTLLGVERVGGGHTMLTFNESSYYAFVYVPGEPNVQHLIRFTNRGVIRSNIAADAISIGAHFESELPPVKK